MQKKDFLGHAKVVSSVQDNDDFTGFLGAQGQVRNSASLVLILGAFCVWFDRGPLCRFKPEGDKQLSSLTHWVWLSL